MATTLFLLKATAGPSIDGYTNDRLLRATRGSAATNMNTAAVSSGNHLEVLDVATYVWGIQIEAVTISGTITCNFRANEGVMTTNAQMAVVISRYNSAGAFISDVVAQANAKHADGVELGTAQAAMNWTITPTSTTFAAGDILVVKPHFDAIGTMGTGGLLLYTDGPTAGASGDSYVTFTETITAYVAAADQPYRSRYPQILAS